MVPWLDSSIEVRYVPQPAAACGPAPTPHRIATLLPLRHIFVFGRAE